MQEILQKAASLQAEIDALEVACKEMGEVSRFFRTAKYEMPEISDEINSVVYDIMEFSIELESGLEKIRELFNKRAHLHEKKKEYSDKWEELLKKDPHPKQRAKQEELANLLRSINI